ncbi:hypothetical protein [Leptolyngbya sp. FACHB-261]|uniref:hypothetical protein n=1 Tax=Leptolyngbya sp. FACHB-261 TaxID=2692806 RepID=UPI0016885D44|nr:hypothetical protein [Leptolyngbya sp. FACHB-261]MBD2100170.1 hypothetical protein [Leptolyngbya sp. FACHB-261]
MQTRQYSFETQRKVGQEGETFLDEWLSPVYKVLDVSEDLKYRHSGIDRVVTRLDGSVITVEYKFDVAAKRTRNLFFETVSNDKEQIPGWGWSSQADYWIFLIPKQEIIVFQPAKLRALVWELQKSLKERMVSNKGYNTIGYPVPLIQARKVAFHIKTLYLENL